MAINTVSKWITDGVKHQHLFHEIRMVLVSHNLSPLKKNIPLADEDLLHNLNVSHILNLLQ